MIGDGIWWNPKTWFEKPEKVPPMILLHYKACLRFMELGDADMVEVQREILKSRGYDVPRNKRHCAKLVLRHGGP